MIVEQPNSHFIFVFSKKYVYGGFHYIKHNNKPLTNKEYLEHWGKWLVLGVKEVLDDLAQRLDPYVEAEKIPCIKFDREMLKEFEDMFLDECVMCIYCDDRDRDDVWQILEKEGVKSKAWKYERDTMALWLPGGLLLEKWISAKGLTDADADKVRKDAENYFEKTFGDDNAIFTGVIQ